MNFDNKIHQSFLPLDITTCEKEPIHIPGAIQPHGVLWEIGEGLKILRVSENVTSVLGWEWDSVLGSEFLETDHWEFDLEEAIRKRFDTSRFNPLNIYFIHQDGS